MRAAQAAFVIRELKDVAVGAACQIEDLGHAVLVRRAAGALDVIEHAGFEPAPGRVIGGLYPAALVEYVSVLARSTCQRCQCCADLRGVEIDDAVERPGRASCRER